MLRYKIVISGFLICILGVGILFLLKAQSNSGPPSKDLSPTQNFKRFLRAVDQGKREMAYAFLSSELAKQAGTVDSAKFSSFLKSWRGYKVTSEEIINSDTALVHITKFHDSLEGRGWNEHLVCKVIKRPNGWLFDVASDDPETYLSPSFTNRGSFHTNK